jgi:hypothetical protein
LYGKDPEKLVIYDPEDHAKPILYDPEDQDFFNIWRLVKKIEDYSGEVLGPMT